MKKRNQYKTGTYTAIVVACLGLFACTKDVFDKKDLQGVDPNIWNTESAATLYLNKTYDLVMPNWPTPGSMHNSTDELNNTTSALLYGQLTDNSVTDIASNNTSSSNNQYFTIRRINLAITGIEQGTLPPDVKAKLKGQMYFFRAFMYFNLVKLYGGVPLVLKSQDIVNDQLNVPRSKSSVCFKQIASDFDSCYGLPTSWPLSTDGGRITRAAAMAYKGKALLYWASPQFNPGNDPTRWETAYQANEAAYDSLLIWGYDLIPNFANIWLDETAGNKERITWRTLDNITVNPARGTNNENISRPYSETSGGGGSNEPTWNAVQAFPMKDGTPIGFAHPSPSDPYNYDTLIFWQNRDPRFDASIAYNGVVWPLSGKTGRRQWDYQSVAEDKANESKTGFYCRKICNPAISASAAAYNSNSSGGSGMDWIDMRFAEVLLNLAECANATGRTSEAVTLLTKLRIRAGVVPGAYNYGLALAATQAQMDSLIMNEREIEFLMEGKRYDDLRRTRRFHLLNGQVRQGYRWAVKSPYTLGTGSNPALIYLEQTNALGFKPRDTANLNNPSTAKAMFATTRYSLETTGFTINFPLNYYFYPLPTNFRLSSISIEQTVGWPGGTFDPLQ